MSKNSLNKFKELIKEAVREVLNEEIENLPKPQTQQAIQPIQERTQIANKYISGDPLMDLLNETKRSMTSTDMGNIGGGANVQGGPVGGSVGNISQMLNTSTALNEESVNIDVVPDYSNMNF